MKKIIAIITAGLMVFAFTGCDARSDKLKETKGYYNVQQAELGYITYDLDGNLSCREHRSRSELTCWKN